MRIAVMGTGAVGGYFGAKLAHADHELAFIARGRHLEAMRRHGLRVLSPYGDLHVSRALFTDDPAQAGEADLVLFCVKSYDTEAAAAVIRPMVARRTMILSLQNGVDNAEKIARLWGEQQTLAGVVYVGAQVDSAGVVRHSTGGKIVFGRPVGGTDGATDSIARALAGADIPNELSRHIRKAQWSKLLWNAPFCALSCFTRAPMEEILRSEALLESALECMGEVQAAAATCGIELPRRLFDQTIEFSKGLGRFRPSMLQDLEAGKPLEHEAFNGVVVRLLRQVGKKAPVNQAFYAALQLLDERIRAAGSVPS